MAVKALVLCLLVTACGGWSGRDTLAEFTFTGVTAVDGLESIEIGRECHEGNPIIGTCGQHLGLYIPATIVLHYAISLALPAGPWRRGWQLFTLGVEASTVAGNYAMGYRP